MKNGIYILLENLLKSKKKEKIVQDFTTITTISVNFLVKKSVFFSVYVHVCIDVIRLNLQFHILKP